MHFFKGRHLWLFFAEPQPAREVVNFAKKILDAAGAPPVGIHREFFPKEPRIDSRALEPMIKLPLGIHKASQRRCLFLDVPGVPFPDQTGVLQNIELITTNSFMLALEKLKTPVTAASSAISAAEQEKIDKILQGCNVLRYLKNKAEKDKQLAHIDRLTILGHLGAAGQQAVHEIIRCTLNYDFRITEKWIRRLKGFPVSCPKIREWQSAITPAVGCFCKFPNLKNSYPAPVLHADPAFIQRIKAKNSEKEKCGSGNERGRVGEQESGSTVAPIPLKQADPIAPAQKIPLARSSTPPLPAAPSLNQSLEKYLELKKQHRALGREMAQIEAEFDRECTAHGTDPFITDWGMVKKVVINNETKWMIEI
jgi:hypothetical protein